MYAWFVSSDEQGTLEFLKLIFRALCLCWDLHVDCILFRGRSLAPISCEVVNDSVDRLYLSSHYPIFGAVRLIEPPTQDWNQLPPCNRGAFRLFYAMFIYLLVSIFIVLSCLITRIFQRGLLLKVLKIRSHSKRASIY